MSLILDALRKLERDKQPRDPSVVVVGHVPWGGRDPGRRFARTVLVGALVLAFAVAGLWLLQRNPTAGTAESPDAAKGAIAAPARRSPGPEPEAFVPTAATAPTPGGADSRPTLTPPAPRPLDFPVSGSAGEASVALVGPEDDSEPQGGDAPGATAGPIPDAAAAPAAGRERTLRLTAISERDGRPVALLNDHLVREGDSFDGVRVLRIGPTEVEVEVDGGKRVIRF